MNISPIFSCQVTYHVFYNDFNLWLLTENEMIMSFILMLPVWYVVFMVPQGSGKATEA